MPPSLGYINGPLVIPNVFQVQLAWITAAGRTASNVLHAFIDDAGLVDQALADNIFAALSASGGWTTFQDFIKTTVSLTGVNLRDLRTAGQPLLVGAGSPVSGLSTVEALPGEVALVVSLKTAAAGRKGRGRVYIPGYTVFALEANGRASAAAVNATSGFIQSVQDSLTGLGAFLVVANRAHNAYTSPATGAEVPAEPAGFNTVTTWRIDTVFDSQRRRKV